MRKFVKIIERVWTASIRRQLILGIVLVHAVLMTIFVFDLVLRQQGFLHEQGVAQTRSLAESLAANSTSWVLANDVLGLEEVVRSQTKYPGLRFAMIVSPLGRVLSHNDAQLVGKYLQDDVSKTLIGIGHDTQVLRDSGNMIDVAAPVMANGQHIGWARVGVSRDDVAQNLEIVTRDGIIYTLGAIAIGVVFAYLMARGMTHSLHHMVEVADQLRDAGKDVRIELDRMDELGTLGTAFNELADAVDERELKLRHQHDHLEELVDARTAELTHEINERKQAEMALRESEERTNLILNSAADAIITISKTGKILRFNTAAERFFGYSVAQAIGQNVNILMPEPYASEHDGYIERYLNKKDGNQIGTSRELTGKRKNGEVFPISVSVSEMEWQGSTVFTGIIRDISARKMAQDKLKAAHEQLQKTQNELVQAEKMASLGGLVAGVAHEINTPIGVGVTAATHMQAKAREIEKSFEAGTIRKSDLNAFIATAGQSMDIISTNLRRASDLIKSFKQVAVDQSSEEARTFSLIEYVEEVLVSLRPQLKQTRHTIIVNGDRDLVVESYPGPIAQILTNLVMNSLVHAYDEGVEGHITINAVRDADDVHLTYCDDGKGMETKTVANVFEPFFTTKRGSGGSGLGMHILYNQVTQTLGGNVTCASELGQGTTFELVFPILNNQA